MIEKESNILEIVKVKAHALQLLQNGKISRRECDELNRQLDSLILECMGPLSDETPYSWLETFSNRFPALPLSPLIRAHQTDHRGQILQLRKKALATGADFLDLSQLYSGLERIPLSQFRWRHRFSQFRSLSNLFGQADLPFEELNQGGTVIF